MLGPFVYLLVVLIIANLAVGRRSLTLVTWLLLTLTNVALLVIGAGIYLQGTMALPPDAAAGPVATPFTPQSGLILALTGVAAFLPLVPPVRRAIMEAFPLDPEHPVHVTAVVFAVYLVGGTVAQFAVDISAFLAETQAQFTVTDLWLQGALFTAFGLVGVGVLMRRSLGDTMRRLDVVVPTWRQVGLALLLMLAFQLFDFAVSYAWYTIDPDSYNRLADLTGEIFENLMTPLGALTIGLTAGIGEEVLFRGALQPRFGLWVTSLLFALGHTQYALSPALVEVFLIGLALGIVRNRENTTTAILIHVTYNTVNVLLAPFWPGQ